MTEGHVKRIHTPIMSHAMLQTGQHLICMAYIVHNNGRNITESNLRALVAQ